MRRRLVVGPLLKSAPVVAALVASPVALGASVQTIFSAENALYGAGYDIGQADGWVDDRLRAAVKEYQKDRSGLTASGELDAMTLKALGVPAPGSQVVGGNTVNSRSAALAELGMSEDRFQQNWTTVASAPEPEPKPEPTVQPEVVEVPEPVSSPEKTVAKAEPSVDPEPAETPVDPPAGTSVDTSEPVTETVVEASPEPKPEPKKVAKVEPVSASQEQPSELAEPEPDSEPVQITSSFGFSENSVSGGMAAAAEEPDQNATPALASAGDSGNVEPALPQEPTAAGMSPGADSGAAPDESESNGNVLTRMFDFLFGWMV